MPVTATTTLQNARRELAMRLGYGEIVGKDGTAWATTAGHVSSATIISTELRDYGFDDILASGSGDDYFQSLFVIFTSGNNNGVVRRIKNYDASAATLTVTGTNLATDTSSVSFEIHKHNPTLLRELLNTARLRAFPQLYISERRPLFTAEGQYEYEVPSAIAERPNHIYLQRPPHGAPNVADNILSNAGFETFSGGSFTSWTADAGLTVAQETATTTPRNYAVYRDQSAARLTNGATGTARSFYQTISSPDTYSGQRLSLSIWAYSLEATNVVTYIRLNSTDNVGLLADGGVHRGTGWEQLIHFEDSLTALTTLRFGIQFLAAASSSLEIYVDEAIAIVGPTRTAADLLRTELFNWDYRRVAFGTTQRNLVRFPYYLPPLHQLIFEGQGYLSSVTNATDAFETGLPDIELLYAYAIKDLYERSNKISSDQDSEHMRRAKRNADRIIEESRPFAMAQYPRRDMGPDWQP